MVPLYNKARYVMSTIESVLGQTLSDFEVIVVDDGSSDGSGTMVGGITDTRVRVVRQANAGVAAARNRGISLARGDWIAFLDADDWMHPRYLETLWATAATHPDVDVVATQFRSSLPGDRWEPAPWALPDSPIQVEIIEDLAARWMTGRVLFSSSVAVRASLLRVLPTWFPAGESYGEDLDLWFRLNERSAIALARRPLVMYRKGVPGSLATTQAADITEQPFLLRMEQRALDGSTPEPLRRSAVRLVNTLRIGLARKAIANGRRREALRPLWRARRAIAGHQWWLTVAMVILAPSNVVKRWQEWRLERHLR